MNDANLNGAIAVAVLAHAEQVDKAGEPYILHVLRVMLRMRTEEERIVAALHDVVEDTNWSLGDLHAQGFGEAVLDAVDALTRRDDEGYSDYIDRVALNPLATAVKLADLADNLDPSRSISAHPSLRERYHRALATLNGQPVKVIQGGKT